MEIKLCAHEKNALLYNRLFDFFVIICMQMYEGTAWLPYFSRFLLSFFHFVPLFGFCCFLFFHSDISAPDSLLLLLLASTLCAILAVSVHCEMSKKKHLFTIILQLNICYSFYAILFVFFKKRAKR